MQAAFASIVPIVIRCCPPCAAKQRAVLCGDADTAERTTDETGWLNGLVIDERTTAIKCRHEHGSAACSAPFDWVFTDAITTTSLTACFAACIGGCKQHCASDRTGRGKHVSTKKAGMHAGRLLSSCSIAVVSQLTPQPGFCQLPVVFSFRRDLQHFCRLLDPGHRKSEAPRPDFSARQSPPAQ